MKRLWDWYKQTLPGKVDRDILGLTLNALLTGVLIGVLVVVIGSVSL